MKTEDDLLEAIARYSLESTGASEGQIDLMMHRSQYAEGFRQMKKEAGAFLKYLITHDSANLPGELRGEKN